MQLDPTSYNLIIVKCVLLWIFSFGQADATRIEHFGPRGFPRRMSRSSFCLFFSITHLFRLWIFLLPNRLPQFPFLQLLWLITNQDFFTVPFIFGNGFFRFHPQLAPEVWFCLSPKFSCSWIVGFYFIYWSYFFGGWAKIRNNFYLVIWDLVLLVCWKKELSAEWGKLRFNFKFEHGPLVWH